MLLINPNSGIYQNIPNIGIAYAATVLGAPVVDLNTMPENGERFLDLEHDEVYVSVRSNTSVVSEQLRLQYVARFPHARISSITNCVDVLCCYPYLDWPDGKRQTFAFDDKLPAPDYELFDSFDIFHEKWATGEWPYSIMTSVGCPFGCTYCASRRRGWTPRSVGSCREELVAARDRWGIKRFDVLDDCFNVDRDRVLEFCAMAGDLELPWACANGLRADKFDEDIARALRASNCEYVSFGVESTDDEVLRRIEKGETFEQIDTAVDIACRYFPGRTNCFFIIGLPGSSYESDLGTLRWGIMKGVSLNFSFAVDHDDESADGRVFNGADAAPMSDAYDKRLQQKIYDHTNYMRKYKFSRFKLLSHIFNTLKLILMFDPFRLPAHLARYVRIFLRRLI